MKEVNTLVRGLKILDLISSSDNGLSSSELATKLTIDKGSMSRFMYTLEKYSYVARDPHTKRYYLGTRIKELSLQGDQYSSLRNLTRPFLETLAHTTSENTHICVWSDNQALTIVDIPSTQALRVVSEVGRRMPLHCSATGKCLLAYSEGYYINNLTPYTKNTITTTTALEKNLTAIRLNEFSLDDEELTLGVRGLACPIRNREGRTIATIGVSGPSVRLTDEAIPTLVKLLKKASLEISATLGYQQNHA